MFDWLKSWASRDFDREFELMRQDRDDLFMRHQEAISECDRLLARVRKAEDELEEAEEDGVSTRKIAENRLREITDLDAQIEKLRNQVDALSAENIEVKSQLEVSRGAFDALGAGKEPGAVVTWRWAENKIGSLVRENRELRERIENDEIARNAEQAVVKYAGNVLKRLRGQVEPIRDRLMKPSDIGIPMLDVLVSRAVKFAAERMYLDVRARENDVACCQRCRPDGEGHEGGPEVRDGSRGGGKVSAGVADRDVELPREG